MAAQQAAIHLPQDEMQADSVASLLLSITRAACVKMAQAAYENGRRDANETIAAVLEKLIGKSKAA